ncbi:TRAP transporter small permease [Marinihelvus fidelis]|uniref:TRAP transporter small permease protein n=1 Tax=Marinihelvus fidelis TaxID=2613842 RepID=A0A5N0T8S2_9GAMM|nr:TRAP transporter small permease [Marinihelvus fidelis]KAA9129699.1 TRAP transporter small permease [Marinihelvus fidelis]
MRRLSEWLDRGARFIATWGLLLMAAAMLFQVVARYGLNEPPAWTEELARIAMLWAGLAGATTALLRRRDPVLVRSEHFASPRLRRAAHWVQSVAVMLFCGVVLWVSPPWLAVHGWRVTEALGLPSQWVVAIVPLACAILIIHALTLLVSESAAENSDNE